MPPIRLGVDGARRLDLAAGGLLDLADDRLRLVVGELDRGRQLDVERSLLARRSAARTRVAISSTSPARPFSASSSRKFRSELVGRRRARPRARSRFARGSSCGLRSSARSSGTSPRRPRRTAPSSSRTGVEPAPLAARPRRARRRRCGATTAISYSPRSSRTEKSSSPTASSISRRWSSSSSTLPVTFSAASSVSSTTSRRICSSARLRLGLDLLARLLEPPLAVGLGLLAHPLALRVGRPGAPRRGSPRPRSSPGRSAPRCSSSRLPRLLAGVVGLVERLRGSGRGARRSPSGSGRRRSASARRA